MHDYTTVSLCLSGFALSQARLLPVGQVLNKLPAWTGRTSGVVMHCWQTCRDITAFGKLNLVGQPCVYSSVTSQVPMGMSAAAAAAASFTGRKSLLRCVDQLMDTEQAAVEQLFCQTPRAVAALLLQY